VKFSPTPLLKLLRRLARSVEANGVRGAVAHSCSRFVRSLRNHGLSGTWERAFRKAPTAPVDREPEPPNPFDLLHGTDTGGYVSGADIQADSLSNLYSTAYLGIAPSAFTQAISALPIQYEKFTFVDLGCGKGRALIVAAQFPFRDLLGVEFAPDLCRIAHANLAINPDWAARISILNQDATDVVYPETPLVIFLFDPFLAPVFRRVLANLERQLHRSPRETYLLYANNPRYTKVLDRFPFLHEISETRYPLSFEDILVDPFHFTHERFTLYSAQLTR
jgi:SAM-dependent methyltransferase